MHPALFNAYQEMLPRIEAEKALQSYQVMLMATGNMKAEIQRDVLNELERAANGHRPRKRERPRSLSDLKAMGIAVIEE